VSTDRDYPQHPPAARGARASGAGTTTPPPRDRVDLLAELPPASLDALWRIGLRRLVSDGQVVQQRGDRDVQAIVVLSGRLRAVAHSAAGHEQLVRWMERGEISGLGSVLADLPAPVDLLADGPTELLIVPKAPLLRWMRSDAEATLLLARVLSLRINELFDTAFERKSHGPSHRLGERVWSTLQAWARENGSAGPPGWTVLRVSQTDVANGVGAARQRVNIELKRLVAEGRVRLGYRRIEIADRA
jgi:CRP-like cAMP-binding protein